MTTPYTNIPHQRMHNRTYSFSPLRRILIDGHAVLALFDDDDALVLGLPANPKSKYDWVAQQPTKQDHARMARALGEFRQEQTEPLSLFPDET